MDVRNPHQSLSAETDPVLRQLDTLDDETDFTPEQTARAIVTRLRKVAGRVSAFHAVELADRRTVCDELFELANDLEERFARSS